MCQAWGMILYMYDLIEYAQWLYEVGAAISVSWPSLLTSPH